MSASAMPTRRPSHLHMLARTLDGAIVGVMVRGVVRMLERSLRRRAAKGRRTRSPAGAPVQAP